MMRSEFIERTKFEPTADEYTEIEEEYYGFNGDKDAFCKQWKKNGGIERLMRRRATRIEELEKELAKKDKIFESRTKSDDIRYHELHEKKQEEIGILNHNIEILRENQKILEERTTDAEARAEEAERKLAVLKEAFEIITGKETE